MALETGVPNLSIISTMNCSVEVANLFYAQKMKLIRAIGKLPYDFIMLDLGAGTSFNTIDFFLTSNEGLFILTPEPTAIENAFRFIKAVYLRRLKQILKQPLFKAIVKHLVILGQDQTITSPSQIMDLLYDFDPEKANLLEEMLNELHFNLILNKYRKQTEEKLGEKLAKLCSKFFYSKFHYLGNVGYDDRVYDAIYDRKIYINTYAYTLTAIDLQNVANRIMATPETILISSKKQ